MILEGLNVTLDIRLDKGIYVICEDSARGKTYLCNMLNMYINMGYNVLGYTYNDYVRGFDLKIICENKNLDILMLDRYDLYKSKDYNKFLLSVCDKMIVLIDCKNRMYVDGSALCHMNLKHNYIEVYDDYII